MLRVVAVSGPSTIVVARDGALADVRLTGIEIVDPTHAKAYLEWTLQSSWVLVEDGRVYRSPDALCINDDMVRKGFARSTTGAVVTTHTATYLGELSPERVTKSGERRAKTATQSRRRPRASHARSTRARRR